MPVRVRAVVVRMRSLVHVRADDVFFASLCSTKSGVEVSKNICCGVPGGGADHVLECMEESLPQLVVDAALGGIHRQESRHTATYLQP